MTTHPLEFGRRHGHTGQSKMPQTGKAQTGALRTPMPHSQKFGDHFVTVKPKSEGDAQHQELVKQTQKWVAQTFYGEMLKQMRNSPFKDKVLSGGKGAESFQAMFDQQLADKMSRGSGKKLVDAMVAKIEKSRKHGGANTVSAPNPAVQNALGPNAPGPNAPGPHPFSLRTSESHPHAKSKRPVHSPTLMHKLEGWH